MCAISVPHDVKNFEEYVIEICLFLFRLFSGSYKLSCIFQNPNKLLIFNLEKQYSNFVLLTN